MYQSEPRPHRLWSHLQDTSLFASNALVLTLVLCVKSNGHSIPIMPEIYLRLSGLSLHINSVLNDPCDSRDALALLYYQPHVIIRTEYKLQETWGRIKMRAATNLLKTLWSYDILKTSHQNRPPRHGWSRFGWLLAWRVLKMRHPWCSFFQCPWSAMHTYNSVKMHPVLTWNKNECDSGLDPFEIYRYMRNYKLLCPSMIEREISINNS